MKAQTLMGARAVGTQELEMGRLPLKKGFSSPQVLILAGPFKGTTLLIAGISHPVVQRDLILLGKAFSSHHIIQLHLNPHNG